MKKAAYIKKEVASLRMRAEAKLRPSKQKIQQSVAQSVRLVHELQVHQLELEIQNGELMESRNRVEALLDTYTDLYDFAPIGYFSLDERGVILETNLTGASLLGIERGLLINSSLVDYLVPGSRYHFQDFLARVFERLEKQICEVMFRHKNKGPFWADLQAESSPTLRDNQKWCRLAVSDLSTLKQAEEAKNRVEVLGAANEVLNQEIARREKLEGALKSSESNANRLLEQSKLMELQLRLLSRQLLKAQEDERKQVSRDLHDEIIQVLVGINVNLGSLSVSAQLNEADLVKQIGRTQRIVEKAVEIVHRFARDLRPDMLDDLGLIPALNSICQDFTKRTKVPVVFKSSTQAESINSTKRTVIFRVAQAALSNIQKHSEATEVCMNIDETPESVRIEIGDNGKSFDQTKAMAKKYNRLGLIGSRERVEMVGGKFEISSSPGNGTVVKAEIPVDPPPKATKTPYEEKP